MHGIEAQRLGFRRTASQVWRPYFRNLAFPLLKRNGRSKLSHHPHDRFLSFEVTQSERSRPLSSRTDAYELYSPDNFRHGDDATPVKSANSGWPLRLQSLGVMMLW